MSPLATGASRTGLIYNNRSSNSLINVPPAVTDPYFSNVSLLLHMDGSNGSATFIDNSNNSLTATVVGDTKISTTQSKFGGASGLFTPSNFLNSYLTFSGSGFSFGTSDFTIEGFIYIYSYLSSQRYLFAFANSGEEALIIENDTLWWFSGGNKRCIIAGLVTNTWHHFAVRRASGVVRIYLNGEMSATTYTDPTNIADNFVRIGTLNGGTNVNNSFTGNFDEVRITKGVSRYTANFTPPTEPFPNS
jgi:hypothetical protein